MGNGWTASNIVSALSEMGLSPEMAAAAPGEQVRIIAAQDPVTSFGFAVIYLTTAEGAESNFSFLTMLPAPRLSPEGAAAINARLATAEAFLEEGYLWIYAELDTSRRFSTEFFRSQTSLYLMDLRMALQLFVQTTQMTMAAVNAFREQLRAGRSDQALVQRLRNEHAPLGPGQEQRRQVAPIVKSIAVEACPECRGTGKRMFRPCKECFGSGEIRRED